MKVRLNESTSFGPGGWKNAPVIKWLEENVEEITHPWNPECSSWALQHTNGTIPVKELYSYINFYKPISEELMLFFCLQFAESSH